MRPKVKVWDYVEEKMMNENEMDNYIIDTGEDGYFHLFKVARFEPLLSTRLKDRLGREIHDGDIIKYAPDDRKAEYLLVEWAEGDAGFFAGWVQWRYVTAYGEVIGNKFENPELLS